MCSLLHSPPSVRSAVQNLRYMDVFQVQAGALRDALLVHQAGHIGRDYVFGAVANVIMRFFDAHARRDGFVGYAEGSAEPATIIRAIDRYSHETLHFGKQSC